MIMTTDLQIDVVYSQKIIDGRKFTSIGQFRVEKVQVVGQDPWFSMQKI